MTERDFFKLLRRHRLKFTWEIQKGRWIRAKHPRTTYELGAIQAVALLATGRVYRTIQPFQAGGALGLDDALIYQLMLAEDIPTHPLREKLVRACGVQA